MCRMFKETKRSHSLAFPPVKHWTSRSSCLVPVVPALGMKLRNEMIDRTSSLIAPLFLSDSADADVAICCIPSFV